MDKLKTWLNDGHGRVSQLAKVCGITHSAVLQWKKVPPQHCQAVEAETGISRHDLRPDIYGPKPGRAA